LSVLSLLILYFSAAVMECGESLELSVLKDRLISCTLQLQELELEAKGENTGVWDLWNQYFSRELQHVKNQLYCFELVDGEQKSTNTIAQLLLMEKQAATDRTSALNLGKDNLPTPTYNDEKSKCNRALGLLNKFIEREEAQEKKYEYFTKDKFDLSCMKPGICVACLNEMEKTYKVCQHGYCLPCILSLVRASLKDTTLIPIRCCQTPFDEKIIYHIGLSEEELGKYHRFAEEVSEECIIHCHNCSELLKDVDPTTNATASCVCCGLKTCVACREAYPHAEGKCKQGWVTYLPGENGTQCPWCNRIVELTGGCHHITCRCRYEFCFVCRKKWKTCTCPLWEEHRLIEAARMEVQRVQPDLDRQDHVQFQREIRRVAAENRHQEHRHKWRKRDGRKRCDTCSWRTDIYFMECATCAVSRCRRCTLNGAFY